MLERQGGAEGARTPGQERLNLRPSPDPPRWSPRPGSNRDATVCETVRRVQLAYEGEQAGGSDPGPTACHGPLLEFLLRTHQGRALLFRPTAPACMGATGYGSSHDFGLRGFRHPDILS